MNPALLFLIRRSFVGWTRSRLVRLKQPRYLLPTLFGIGYFVLIFSGMLFDNHGPSRNLAPLQAHARLAEWGIGLLVFGMAALTWILPSRKPGLVFKESEVANLFPAPLPRRDLVALKVLTAQGALLFTAGMMAFFASRVQGPGSLLRIFVALWLTMNALFLHQIGARFVQASLGLHGWAGFKRQVPALLIGLGAAAALWFTLPAPPSLVGLEGFADLVERVEAWLTGAEGTAAGWVLLPFRVFPRLGLAADLPAFAAGLGTCVGINAALYLWVVRADVAFEEAAAEVAAQVAQVKRDLRQGRLFSAGNRKKKLKVRRAAWELAPSGSIEAAFIWQQVTALTRAVSPAMTIVLALAVAIGLPALDALLHARTGKPVPISTLILGMLSMMLVFAAQNLPRLGMRGALGRIESLKTLPIAPVRLVRAVLLGAIVPIVLTQAFLLFIAALAFPGELLVKAGLDESWRVAVVIGALTVGAGVTTLSLTLDGAAALLFPAWLRPPREDEETHRGIEMMGQNLLVMFGKFLVLALALVAPAVLGGGLAALGLALLPSGAHPVAVAAAGFVVFAVLLAESALVTLWMGRRFTRLDPAAEGLVR